MLTLFSILWRFRDVARLPNLFNLIESEFLLQNQVDIFYVARISHTQHKHTRMNLGRARNLVLAMHEESAERAESHDRRRFFNRKYGRNREPVLVVNIVAGSIVEGKSFW